MSNCKHSAEIVPHAEQAKRDAHGLWIINSDMWRLFSNVSFINMITRNIHFPPSSYLLSCTIRNYPFEM